MNAEFNKENNRVKRITRALNIAIQKNDAKVIRKWQGINCRHYGITFADWLPSQTVKRKEDIELIKTEWNAGLTLSQKTR